MTVKTKVALAAMSLLVVTATAAAEPALQLYLQGGTYDPVSESWVVPDTSGPLTLWVIAKSPVSNVRLSVAYSATETPTISLKGSTTGGYGGFTDNSTPADVPAAIQTVTDGSSPLLSDGSSLPSHGVYGDGTAWQEFSLGSFTMNDSPIADFIDSFPNPSKKHTGQINVYDVNVSGATALHFDVYDSVAGAYGATFGPFSHDAGSGAVPAPAAALLALIGLGATNLLRRYLT